MMKSLSRKIFCLTCMFMLFAVSCFAGLAPLPQSIGTSDGEWVYMGRYLQYQPSPSILEWETRLLPYTRNGEIDNLFDVYYHHEHNGTGEGQGCKSMRLPSGEIMRINYACVLKIVPLDKTGKPFNKSGEKYATRLVSMSGRAKGAFAARVDRLRMYDSATHRLIGDYSNHPQLNGNFQEYIMDWNVKGESPFYKSWKMSGCVVSPYDGSMG